ncbi:MAG: hypothetical protein ACOX4I_06635 [Anaerovoracaceae bacterium]
MAELFSRVFFRLYDRKIAAGEIVYRQLQLDNNDFTLMCTRPEHVPDMETVERLVVTMKCTDEEAAELRRAAIEHRKEK